LSIYHLNSFVCTLSHIGAIAFFSLKTEFINSVIKFISP
jgi:hypothetical protein